ncbi:MAG: adenylate/guanylate cyclase domain-containing protein [Pseudacidovorax sp.]|nr:adenylate/guanylate cyclase domain-containing protein [Pseudacidovorax sp.]
MTMATTVVFADLTGSTRVFEAMGNARATDTVTRLVQWVGDVCEAHGGRVIKKLGDGIFALFPAGAPAISAMLEVQRSHHKRLLKWPEALRMDLQIGIASGEVVEVDGDFYGDAVNVASRLSDLAGPGQIWATESVVDQRIGPEVRHRSLGPISIRGRQETPTVHRIDWQDEVVDLLTLPAALSTLARPGIDTAFGQIELSWLDVHAAFGARDLPIHLGRVDEADFVVNDPRVSRLHARIEARNGSCILTDVSSYGTWVRFRDADGSSSEVALRRDECMLHGSGEISLGAPLSDFTAPTISFHTAGGRVQLAMKADASQ